MKLEILANDFCPDDCPYCKPYKTLLYEDSFMSTCEWGCENMKRCKFIAEAIKGDEKENEITNKTE